MPSLESVLGSIPGIGGYEAARQVNERRGIGDLQKMGVLAQLAQRMQAQQREQKMRADLASLGPNPDQNALAQVAAKYP